jgi:hypothetical protein
MERRSRGIADCQLPIADLEQPNNFRQIDNSQLAIGNGLSRRFGLATARDGIHQSALTNTQ